LRFAYPGGAAALAGFDLAVAAGDFLALVGENGGGKTTFAKALAGLLRPAAGTLTVAGERPAALPPRRRACLVGYLFQNPDHQIFRPTVAEEILFGPRQLGLDGAALGRRLEAALAATGLAGREEEDPFALAKGDRQRVALASVLAMEPEILVMDEPTTGLDRREVASLMAAVTALNRQGTTVIFITHAMDVVARYARRVAVVAGGRVIGEGPVRRVLTDDGLLARAGLRPPLPLRLGRALGVECLTDEELSAALDAPGPGER
jgi:energy-coupling factor transport system ATP-binding protein